MALRISAVAALLATCFFASAAAQERPVVEEGKFYRVESRLVGIPVYVTDEQGKPVGNLAGEDFAVREEGKACRVVAVDYIDHTSARWGDYASSPPESRRQFLLVFDLSFTNVGGLKAALGAARQFLLSTVADNDLVGVVTISLRGGVSLLCPFTTRRSQTMHALATLGLKDSLKYKDPAGFAFDGLLDKLDRDFEQRASAGSVGEEALGVDIAVSEGMALLADMAKRADNQRYAGMAAAYVSQLNALAVGLGELRGRKNVLFFSEGFDSKSLIGKTMDELARDSDQMATLTSGNESFMDADNSGGSGLLRNKFADALNSFRVAGAVFYVVDTGRLSAGFEDADSRRRGQDTLSMIAERTGGTLFKNLNDLGGVLRDIGNRTSAGYLVVFEQSGEGKPGDFRKVEISTHHGLNVDHQPGYLISRDFSEQTPQEKAFKLAEFVSKDIISKQMPFEMVANAFPVNEKTTRIAVAMELDGSAIFDGKQERRSESIELEFLGYLLDMENKPLDFFYNKINYGRKDFEQLRRGGLKYYDMLACRPGNYKVKCIVRDAEIGRISSDIKFVTAPDLGGGSLSMCGPVFLDMKADRLLATSPGSLRAQAIHGGKPAANPYAWGPKSWLPAAKPSFSKTDTMLFYARIHGLTPTNQESGSPQVRLKFELVDGAGLPAELKGVSLVGSEEIGDLGAFDILFQVDLSALEAEAGEYRLRFSLTDAIAGREVSGEAPFVLR